MKTPLWLTAATLLVTVAATTSALTQDKKGQESPKDKKAMDASAATAWKNYSTPNDNHKVLDPMVGKWSYKVKDFSMGTPSESTATSERKWVMDGRFVEETVDGTMMGQPFHGMGHCGYDNIKKKYVSSWIDNMGTGVMTAEGTYDAPTKTFTFESECPDPESGRYVKGHSTEKWTDNDHVTMQMFGPGPDGKDMLKMELQGTRVK